VRKIISPIEAANLLAYDPATGVLTWRHRDPLINGSKSFNTRYAGKIAGCKADGEIVVNIRVNGKQVGFRAHHLAWVINTGEWPQNIVDHKDGDAHNNKWENLRSADHSGNNANRHIVRGASRFKGVAPFGKRWSASVTHRSKQHWIGVFDTEDEAARSYDSLAAELHGEFAKTNAALGLL